MHNISRFCTADAHGLTHTKIRGSCGS